MGVGRKRKRREIKENGRKVDDLSDDPRQASHEEAAGMVNVLGCGLGKANEKWRRENV